jgi:hypothetical protein
MLDSAIAADGLTDCDWAEATAEARWPVVEGGGEIASESEPSEAGALSLSLTGRTCSASFDASWPI